MKILFLSDNFPPETNAAATRVYERACYWVKWGHDVTVLTCAPNFPQGKVYPGYKNKWYQEEVMDGIRVIRVKTFMSANQGFTLRILDFLSYMFMAIIVGSWQKKPDIVVATSPQFFAAVGGWLLSGIKRKPFVFELSDIWPASITAVGAMKQSRALQYLEKLELFLYRRSAKVIALTQAFKQNLIKRGIDEKNIAVVINGVDQARYQPGPKPKDLLAEYQLENKFVVGYLGTQGMAHALENVLHAAKQLQDTREIHFLFVGQGAAHQSLLELSQQLALDNVTFVGAQTKQAMPNFWRLCDVALVHLKDSPVFAEVIPSKLFEAMAMAKPILLAAPEGEAVEIVRNHQVGVTVPAQQAQALVAAVNDLFNNAKQLSHYQQQCLQAVVQFSREKQARDMLQLLQDCVQK